MQRISKFPACGRYVDMSLLTHSRRQRYGKILELANNLKGNIWERPPKKPLQSQPASAKLQNVFKELALWSRKV